jgi:hypothetical protein
MLPCHSIIHQLPIQCVPYKSTRVPIQTKSSCTSPLINIVSPVYAHSIIPPSFASLLSTVQAFQVFRHSLDWGRLWNDSFAVTCRRGIILQPIAALFLGLLFLKLMHSPSFGNHIAHVCFSDVFKRFAVYLGNCFGVSMFPNNC